MVTEQQVNVLLVDDRPENLVALESVLSGLGQNLIKATSGREALKRLLSDEFAVILLDVQMPGMDGFETATLIRSREKSQHVPIVFLTAINKSDVHVSRGYSVGGVDYVFKPFDPDVLKAKVSAFVELAKTNRELKAEVVRRQSAEEEVRRLNQGLERRVAARTAELETANRELEKEIAERQRASEDRMRLLALEQAARAEAEAAQGRLAFLGEASVTLSASLHLETTLERLARLAAPFLADFCIVDVTGEDGVMRRVATAHRDPAKDQRMRGLQRVHPADGGPLYPLSSVLRTGEPEVVSAADAVGPAGGEWVGDDWEIFHELAPHSYLVAPLRARGETMGQIICGAVDPDRRYGAQEIALAEDLACRGAAAIDNARLFHEVQDAGRRKDEFLAMLAHELRNPLAAISNAAYLLDGIDAHDSRVNGLHAVINRQTGHLCRLVDDLLDISRITRGKITLREEVVDLALVARRALETTQPLLTLREHEVFLSEPAEPVWVEADPTRLEQVLANLLNNAAKYTERGGKVWLTVEQSAAEGAPCGVVRVRDTGIGIAPEMLPRMFDLFTQAERSLERAEGGMGIGLSLVQSLVRMHGGTVSAASPGPGGGSEFTVTLPALVQAPPTVPPTEPTGEMRRSPGAGAATGPRRVLLVEDNVDAAETLVEMLDTWGHDVRCVHDGRAALNEISIYRADVVLLDIGLPGMDGYEVARRLREQERRGEPRMLLIALTGYGQEENRKLALDAGFDLHLTKPVDAPELQRMLSGALPRV